MALGLIAKVLIRTREASFLDKNHYWVYYGCHKLSENSPKVLKITKKEFLPGSVKHGDIFHR